MNLAVKFYKDVENKSGIPGDWPAEVIEIGEASHYDCRPGPWTIMTSDEYERHRERFRKQYDAWASQKRPIHYPYRPRKEKLKDFLRELVAFYWLRILLRRIRR